MFKRVLKRVVYFGIPVFMWLAGAACVAEKHQEAYVPTAAYRCARVGCGKTVQAAAAPAACTCGAAMVSDDARRVSWAR